MSRGLGCVGCEGREWECGTLGVVPAWVGVRVGGERGRE